MVNSTEVVWLHMASLDTDFELVGPGEPWARTARADFDIPIWDEHLVLGKSWATSVSEETVRVMSKTWDHHQQCTH